VVTAETLDEVAEDVEEISAGDDGRCPTCGRRTADT